MSTTFVQKPELRLPCPTCDTHSGVPYRATTVLGDTDILVGMRCRECGSEWKTKMAPAEAILILKPDRRAKEHLAE